MSGIYFEGNYPELVCALEQHFERVRESWKRIADKSSAVVLGGGYGRGEGGVRQGRNGPELFNDLDYFLFTDQPHDSGLVSWAKQLEKEETAALGVDVEIKLLPESDAVQGIRSMMFTDLVAGHVLVAGNADFLDQLRRQIDFSLIGADEASRLLWNRGSGLFFARGNMLTDLDFVARNHAKLKLALGDAWLCLKGKYISQCRERGRRFSLEQLPAELEPLHAYHLEAVEYKFQPLPAPESADRLMEESRVLAALWLRLFLLVESARLGRKIHTLEDYLALRRIYPASPVWRNLAICGRDYLKKKSFLKPITDYPRASLMRALPCLLELDGKGFNDVIRYLPAPAQGESWQHLYGTWWQAYS
jgi:hypothetical protein